MPFDEPTLNDVPLPLPCPDTTSSSHPTGLPPGDSPLSAIDSGDESEEEDDIPFDVLYGNARTGLEEGGLRSMECNDGGGAAAKKSKKAERTGATHLIHGGAMQGRKTAVSISQILSCLRRSVTKTCVFRTRCTIPPILATPSPGAKSRHGTFLPQIPLLFGLQRISKSFGLASTPNIGKRSMLEYGSVRIVGLSSGV